MLRFMAKHLAIIGCDPLAQGPSHLEPPIVIRTCSEQSAGGFGPGHPTNESGMLICSNHINSKKHLEDTFAHEMIHWWDHCRFQVNWDDLRHHACSEIRAANLSGDCGMSREIERREYGFAKQHQVSFSRGRSTMYGHCSCPP